MRSLFCLCGGESAGSARSQIAPPSGGGYRAVASFKTKSRCHAAVSQTRPRTRLALRRSALWRRSKHKRVPRGNVANKTRGASSRPGRGPATAGRAVPAPMSRCSIVGDKNACNAAMSPIKPKARHALRRSASCRPLGLEKGRSIWTGPFLG